jgi:hypothetical protein
MPVDVSAALDLRLNHNLPYSKIAALQGVSPQAIHKRIKALLPDNSVQDYVQQRANILAAKQINILESVDDKRLADATLNNLAFAFTQLYNAERLERGLSTENIDIRSQVLSISATIDQLRQAIKDAEGAGGVE